ncbi:MAG: response regulator [Macromonas sp.]
MANILVVDDELGIRDLLSEILNDEGHAVELAENAAQARALRASYRPDLVLLDIWMPDTDGVTLLKEWSANGLLTMPVIMMSGHATIDTAVEATRIGAMAFLEKPITLQKLLQAVDKGLSKAKAMPPDTGRSVLRDPVHAAMPVVPLALLEGTLSSAAGGAAASGATFVAADPLVSGHGMPPSQRLFMLDVPLREARDAFEKAYFEFHLAQENGSMTRVAEKTGLERTHLYRKLKQLGVDLSRSKRHGP